MINIEKTKKYCRENIAAIENYEKAINDNTQTWEIHHRLEVQEDGTLISRDELIERGLYWDRHPDELIFLTKADHTRLHATNRCEETRRKLSETSIGKKLTAEAKQKISKAKIGKKHTKEAKQKMRETWEKRKLIPVSEETKKKMSEAQKGKKRHPLSDETKKKISEAHKGKTLMLCSDGKRHWIEKNSSISLF